MSDLLEAIAASTKSTRFYTGIGTIDPKVMAALGRVDRQLYVPDEARHLAYENHPLGIGHGQTISQPFIVALMTHALDLQPSHRVLEIGTGSGYQAAILAELAEAVFTIEIVPELADTARHRLAGQGYGNVSVKAGDGWYGWPEHGPFDSVIVTAVAPDVPPRLVAQLKEGGVMVLPVGDPQGDQDLIKVTKTADGIDRSKILPVRFVPMTGEGILTLRE